MKPTAANPHILQAEMSSLAKIITSCLFVMMMNVGHTQVINDTRLNPDARDSAWIQSAKQFLSSFVEYPGIDSLRVPDYNTLIPSLKKTGRGGVPVSKAGKTRRDGDFFEVKGGYIQYTLNYRSAIDTPFAENNITQHLAIVKADILVAGQLPFTVVYSGRQSNSALFRDFNDVQVSLNTAALHKLGYDRLTNNVNEQLRRLDDPASWDELALRQFDLNRALDILSDVRLDNFLIDSRKNLLQLSKENYSSAFKDSLRFYSEKIISNYDSLQSMITKRKHSIDSLHRELIAAKKRVATIRKILSNPLQNKESLTVLRKQLDDAGVNDERTSRLLRRIYAVRTLSVGRTLPDYSSLSVKNINVKGVNLEYNDERIYLAFTAGVLDMRIRDFVYRKSKGPLQYVWAARAGIGQRDGTHWIVTGFRGRKQLYFSPESEASDLYGITSAFQFVRKRYTISLEVAQSSSPAGNDNSKTRIDFSDKNSRAIHISGNANLPRLQATIDGYYQRTGQNFQSFNSYRVNADNRTWSFRWEQYLWEKQLRLSASLRKNDFSNPLIVQNYKTNTVFKTFQLSFRKKKWPAISAGYIPSSQYAVVDQTVFESRYHTLHVNASHSYKIGVVRGTSMLTVSRFYNDIADTGFYYYRANYISGFQQFLFPKMMLSAGATITSSPEYKHYTMHGGVAMQPMKLVRVELGVRINDLNNLIIKSGAYGNLRLSLPKLGDLQCWYEDNYLPGRGNVLTRNEQMNISFTRYFK